MNLATALRLLSALLFAGGFVYLYVDFEKARTGAIGLVDYLWPFAAIIVLAVAIMAFAGRLARGRARADETAGTF